MLSRRLFLSSAAAFAAASAGTAFAGTGPLFGFDPAQLFARAGRAEDPIDGPLDPEVRASRIAWLEEQTHEFDSLDFDDNEFEDLEAFGKAVGDARIVMLGVQTHGDGTTFRAKARLIRFLHEEIGFDVLAFESGLYDMHRVWERIRAGEDARKAVRRGLFGIWSRSRQVQPLIDYVGERARSRRPLELAGFDCQFNGNARRDRLVDDLNAFLAAQRVDTASVADWSRFCTVLDKIADGSIAGQWKPSEEERDLVLSTLDVLTGRIASAQGAEAAFWRQLFRSTKAHTQYRVQVDLNNITIAATNVRDAAMGDNLIWLAREAFPRRKIIVWAATYHNMRNPHLIETGNPYLSYAKTTTMGHLVWQAFGEAVYSVGFTAYEGQHGWVGTEPKELSPPFPDSLEGLWGETRHDNAFLDLRRIPAGGDWLRTPLVGQPLGYADMLADWSQVLDAMVFTRTMRPSTLAE